MVFEDSRPMCISIVTDLLLNYINASCHFFMFTHLPEFLPGGQAEFDHSCCSGCSRIVRANWSDYNLLMSTSDIRQSQITPWPAAVEGALRDLQAALLQMYGRQAPHVLLLYPGQVATGREIQRLGGILAELNLRYQVLISALPVSRADWENAHSAFWNNVRREGVALA